jgi:hypothetical protein
MNRLINILCIAVGIILIGLAFVYWFTPANSLPSILPGHNPNVSGVHVKHGIAAFLLGLVVFAYTWFRTRKKA